MFRKHYKMSRPSLVAVRSNAAYARKPSFQVKRPLETESKMEESETESDGEVEQPFPTPTTPTPTPAPAPAPPSPDYRYPFGLSSSATDALLDACEGFGEDHSGKEPPKKKVRFQT